MSCGGREGSEKATGKGGIPPGVLVDVFGANGTGKTQLLLQLCINCVRDGNRVLYVDTTGAFRPERIVELQKKHVPSLDPPDRCRDNADCRSRTKNEHVPSLDLLDGIVVSRVTNTYEQMSLLNTLRDAGDDRAYSLILIDNVTDLFSYEYQRRENVFEKNSTFMRYLSELSAFAITKKIPIVMTNMIRTVRGEEVENMRAAISPFTHIRIHMSRKMPEGDSVADRAATEEKEKEEENEWGGEVQRLGHEVDGHQQLAGETEKRRYCGTVTWALNHGTFDYQINESGLRPFDGEDI